MKAKFDWDIEGIYREFASSYFCLSAMYFYERNKDNKNNDYDIYHFHNLTQYFGILTTGRINLSRMDWRDLGYIKSFVKEYIEKDLEFARTYLSSLKDFIDYCKKIGESRGLAEAGELWNLLCDKFGEDAILEVITNSNFNRKN